MKIKHILLSATILMSAASAQASLKCPANFNPFLVIKNDGKGSSIIDYTQTVDGLNYHWTSTPFQASAESITSITPKGSEMSSGLTCDYRIKSRDEKPFSVPLSLIELVNFDPEIKAANVSSLLSEYPQNKGAAQKVKGLIWGVKTIENPLNIRDVSGVEFREDTSFTKISNGFHINLSYRFYDIQGQSGLIFLKASFLPGE